MRWAILGSSCRSAEHRKRHPEDVVVTHWIGSTSTSTCHVQMLHRHASRSAAHRRQSPRQRTLPHAEVCGCAGLCAKRSCSSACRWRTCRTVATTPRRALALSCACSAVMHVSRARRWCTQVLDTFKRWILFDLPKLNTLHKRIVFVVDGLDQLEDRHGAAALLWYALLRTAASARWPRFRPVDTTHAVATKAKPQCARQLSDAP